MDDHLDTPDSEATLAAIASWSPISQYPPAQCFRQLGAWVEAPKKPERRKSGKGGRKTTEKIPTAIRKKWESDGHPEINSKTCDMIAARVIPGKRTPGSKKYLAARERVRNILKREVATRAT